MEITLDLPEKIYQDVSLKAQQSKRKVVDLIVDVVEEKYSKERLLASLSNEEVLALAKLQMPKNQSQRHSELLFKNQSGTLNLEEKRELEFFQQVYGVALSRKTDGIYEAIQRKLIKSPEDITNE